MKQCKKLVLEALHQLNEQQLIERSLGRLYSHLNKGNPIGFVSGDRDENTKQQNKENFAELKRLVQLGKFGYNTVHGGYVEEHGKLVDNENSLVIYGTREREQQLYDLLIALGKKFNQSSVLFVDSSGNSVWISTREDSWIGPVGTKRKLGKFTTNNINDFYTKIGNKTFKFASLEEQVEYFPNNYEKAASNQFCDFLNKFKQTVLDHWYKNKI